MITLTVLAAFLAVIALAMDVASAAFEEKVLGGLDKIESSHKTLKEDVGKVQTNQEKMLSDYSRLDGETKKAFEDLTKVKNNCNDLDTVLKTLQKTMVQLKAEERSHYGDPLRRMLADPEKALHLDAAIRNTMRCPHKVPGTAMTEAHTKALSTGATPGSTMIDDKLLNEIYDSLSTFGVWNTFAVRRMSTKQTKLPIKTARPIALVVDEAGEIVDDANKAGTSVTLEVKKIAVRLDVSSELLEDSEFNVAADVMADFMEAYAFRLDHFCLNAAGVANTTDGSQTGVFAGGTAAAAAMGNTTVAATQLADWVRCLTTVDPIVLRRMARWWIHPQMLARTLNVVDDNGRPIFQTALETPAAGSIGTILGYPVSLAFAAPNTDAASGKVAVFGDPGALVVGIRRDYAFDSSIHFKWDRDQTSFRGIGRAAVKIRAATAIAVLTLAAA